MEEYKSLASCLEDVKKDIIQKNQMRANGFKQAKEKSNDGLKEESEEELNKNSNHDEGLEMYTKCQKTY